MEAIPTSPLRRGTTPSVSPPAWGIQLFSVTTRNFNTAVGAGSLDLNQADSNTATGAAALLFNTTGTENTAVGAAALEFNDTGSFNTANGAFALFSNTTGLDNTAVGNRAMQSNFDGSRHTAVGSHGLLNCTAPPISRGTRPLALQRSSATPPATSIRLSVTVCSSVTLLEPTTQPSVWMLWLATPKAALILPPALTRSYEHYG